MYIYMLKSYSCMSNKKYVFLPEDLRDALCVYHYFSIDNCLAKATHSVVTFHFNLWFIIC